MVYQILEPRFEVLLDQVTALENEKAPLGMRYWD